MPKETTMDHDILLTKLRLEVEYAWNSYSLPLVYQAHGKVCMAADLRAITYEEFRELDTKLIRDGLNNPSWFNDPRFHMV